MSTNEQEGPPQPSQRERVLAAVGMTAAKITDTAPVNPSMPLRVWVMLTLLGGIVATCTPPLNVVGTVVVIALALTLASRSRNPR